MAAATWAFVDEYGNPNLATEVPGASKFFIVTAVILGADQIEGLRACLEPLRQARFQRGPMKSKKLGDDRAGWMRLLSSFAAVPFRFYALVVDKQALDRTGGLRWKQSFYKHLCGRVYGKLMRAFPALHVRADNYGGDSFKESFARYIEENHRPTLFDRGTFDFVSSKDDVLIQLADILCGLLARCYDPDLRFENAEELLRLVQEKVLILDEWPPRYRLTAGADEINAPDGRDPRIATYSLSQAEKFVIEHENDTDPDMVCRIGVVERLLFQRRFGEEHSSVQAGELLENLRERRLEAKEHRWFRTTIIASLRDHGVLLTSSSAGYKLPVSEADLVNFVRQAEAICVPMLNRVETACRSVKLLTKNEIDVLARPELAIVRDLLDALRRRDESG